MKAVRSVLTEGRFQVSSQEATAALSTASAVILWCEEPAHCELLTQFTVGLTARLKTCFQCNHSSLRLKKEKMWGLYHQLRTSKNFKEEWSQFLQASVGHQASPAFFQFVTHTVFKELITMEYPIAVHTTTPVESPQCPLTYEEENALRYIAGYVCRKLRERLESSSLPSKDDMILCLMELNGDEMDEERGTEAWTNLIDRGGLWHVNDQTYSLFATMEEEIRQHLSLATASRQYEGARKQLIDSIFLNEDLLFQWAILAAEMDNDVTSAVLKQIVKLYVTIRGFAFTTSCLELYKQAHKKTLQKKKALRRELCPSD